MRQLILWQKAAHPPLLRAQTQGDGAAPAGLDTAEHLAAILTRRLQQPVFLTLTRNRSTMVSFKREHRGIVLRLHEMFVTASQPVLDIVCDFVLGKKHSGKQLDKFVAARAHQVKVAMPPLRTAGCVYDLRHLFCLVNDAYFHGACQAHITWGRLRRRRSRSIALGLYTPSLALITINPVLDDSSVPSFYICFVIFHEMLHELFGIDCCEHGRRRMHPPEFRLVESSHPDYARCMQWEHHNIARLLRQRAHPTQRGVRKVPGVGLTNS